MHKTLPLIREKKEIVDAYQRFQGEQNRLWEDWEKLEFVYVSNLIDGGNLSRAETNQVTQKGLTIGGKTLQEQNSAVVCSQAVDLIRRSASLTRHDVDEQLLIGLHHLPTLAEKETGFLKYTYQVPYVLTEFAEWLHQEKGTEVEVAVATHVKLLQLKPFKDNNPQTARLLMNLLLLQDGYPLALTNEEDVEWCRSAVEEVMAGGSESGLIDILYDSILRSLSFYIERIENRPTRVEDSLWKIGQLAKATGESIPTIRHWTKQGLLKVEQYSEGGYQLYQPEMAEVVLKIRELQQNQRMSIKEIQQELGNQGLDKVSIDESTTLNYSVSTFTDGIKSST